MTTGLLFKDEVFKIVGAMEVNKVLNRGAQIINALKATKKKVGLLVNFGEPSLYWKRYVY